MQLCVYTHAASSQREPSRSRNEAAGRLSAVGKAGSARLGLGGALANEQSETSACSWRKGGWDEADTAVLCCGSSPISGPPFLLCNTICHTLLMQCNSMQKPEQDKMIPSMRQQASSSLLTHKSGAEPPAASSSWCSWQSVA